MSFNVDMTHGTKKKERKKERKNLSKTFANVKL